MSTPTNLIHLSFELAAERCEDLTPAVYRRLFREHPEAEAMFRREAGDLVKGSMLAMAIGAMIDFAGDRGGSFRMIECEAQSHDAYGTPRKLFGEFFGVIAQTMREILGNDWSPRSRKRGGSCCESSIALSLELRANQGPQFARKQSTIRAECASTWITAPRSVDPRY